MILEENKDTVFFSSLFAKHYRSLYNEIRKILRTEGIPCELVKGTKDYWCRDYMPVQADGHSFVQFRYHPDYLHGRREFETDTDAVMKKSFPMLHTIRLPFIADGGNFVMAPGRDGKRCVIMTMKTRYENHDVHDGGPVIVESMVNSIVKDSLHCDAVINIPWDEDDELGHADGIVRFAGYSKRGIPRVLVNRKLYDRFYSGSVLSILKEHFQVIDLDLSSYDELSWAYINALQASRCIIVPGIGLPTDEEALRQYEKLFPSYLGHIHMVQMRDFIKEWNGALNCLSWTIKSDRSQYTGE